MLGAVIPYGPPLRPTLQAEDQNTAIYGMSSISLR